MAEVPPIPSLAFNPPELNHHYAAKPLSNLSNVYPQLRNPHLAPPPHYPSSWRPTTLSEFNNWNQSPQGMFPSTLIGPGSNPNLLPSHPQPRQPGAASTNNSRRRKRGAPSGETSSVGGFGPLSPGNTGTEASSSSPSLPPLGTLGGRRNGASDVWAFARPLASTEPPPEDQWPTSLEPYETTKPKTPWFGCKFCSEFGYVVCTPTGKGSGLIPVLP